MTKREAAEQRKKLCAIVQKYDGCLYRRCDKCVLNVADNPVDDWQELKIDDLPRDIFVSDRYEIQFIDYSCMEPVWADRCGGMDAGVIKYMLLADGIKYRFRTRQPEKKEVSHEEMLQEIFKPVIIEFDKLCDNIRSILDTTSDS